MSLHFLGIGAQKSATTWLYTLLNAHPMISFPAGKEVHFWNRYEQGNAHHPLDYTQPAAHSLAIDPYLASFAGNDTLGGDITPAYAILHPNTIRLIYSYRPLLKLIFITRNPIDRAWSSALMALNRAQMEIDEASDQWFIDHFHSHGSRARGYYARTLDNWLSVFPKEQLLLLQYDTIATAPETVAKEVCTFLGIDPTPLNRNPLLHQRVFEGTKHALRPSLHPILEELYRPLNQELLEKYGIAV
jgi:hypothetical protein